MTSLRLLLALILLACPAAAGASDVSPRVIVLSWDGVRSDYPGRGRTPALDRLRREGAAAEHLVPVFPSLTFPAHVSLATGTHPDRHGIVGNVFLDRERGLYRYEADASWIQAEPLWVAAERQGVRAACFFWVGSETDWQGRGASLRRAPFDADVPESEKVDQILAWLDLPPEERPGLIMSWWHGADHAGHEHGPDDQAVRAALETQDAELSRLLDGLDARSLWDTTTLLLVSDHGMAPVSEAVDLETPLETAGIPGRVLPLGGLAHVFLEDPGRREEAVRAISGLDGVRLLSEADLRQRRAWHPQRTGDLVVGTRPPRVFRRTDTVARLWFGMGRLLGRRWGMHGYDPAEVPEMNAVFLALGRGVVPGGRLGVVHGIDVAPTVAALLGILPPAESEGVARLPMAPGARLRPEPPEPAGAMPQE